MFTEFGEVQERRKSCCTRSVEVIGWDVEFHCDGKRRGAEEVDDQGANGGGGFGDFLEGTADMGIILGILNERAGAVLGPVAVEDKLAELHNGDYVPHLWSCLEHYCISHISVKTDASAAALLDLRTLNSQSRNLAE